MSGRRHCAAVALDGSVYIFGGDDPAGGSEIIEIFSVKTGKLTGRSDSKPRQSPAAAVLKKEIYVIGGYDYLQKSLLDKVFIYNHSFSDGNEDMGSWATFGPDLNTARAGHAAVTVGEAIYVIGGIATWEDEAAKLRPVTTNNVEVLDKNSNSDGGWKTLPSKSFMKTPRAFFAAAVYGRHFIYAAGGVTGTLQSDSSVSMEGWVGLSSVERFDVETQVWTTIAPMIHARYSFGMAVVVGGAGYEELHVFGGRSWNSEPDPNLSKGEVLVTDQNARPNATTTTTTATTTTTTKASVDTRLCTCKTYDNPAVVPFPAVCRIFGTNAGKCWTLSNMSTDPVPRCMYDRSMDGKSIDERCSHAIPFLVKPKAPTTPTTPTTPPAKTTVNDGGGDGNDDANGKAAATTTILISTTPTTTPTMTAMKTTSIETSSSSIAVTTPTSDVTTAIIGSTDASSSSGNVTGIIGGIVAVVLLALLAFGVYYYRQNSASSQNNQPPQNVKPAHRALNAPLPGTPAYNNPTWAGSFGGADDEAGRYAVISQSETPSVPYGVRIYI